MQPPKKFPCKEGDVLTGEDLAEIGRFIADGLDEPQKQIQLIDEHIVEYSIRKLYRIAADDPTRDDPEKNETRSSFRAAHVEKEVRELGEMLYMAVGDKILMTIVYYGFNYIAARDGVLQAGDMSNLRYAWDEIGD